MNYEFDNDRQKEDEERVRAGRQKETFLKPEKKIKKKKRKINKK